MEEGLEAELDEELGYSKYDYKNKDTDNSRNGHSSKRLRTSFGEVDVSVPRDRKGEFEPQVLKKNQTSIGLRFFLVICNSSCVVLLFYTTQEVYTNFGMFSSILCGSGVGSPRPQG